jgi:acyl carrier protein
MDVWYLRTINNLKMINKEATINQLKTIIKPFINNIEAFDTLTEDTDFITDLNINSANLVDIILDIEEAFAIDIDNQSMERMLTIKAALEIIETKLAEK